MINLSNSSMIAAADAVTAQLAAGGEIRVYTGPMPASPEVAISTQVLLATFTLPTPAYDPATVTGDIATAIGNAIAAINPTAAGTAVWARVVDSGGAPIFDGDAGLTGSTAFARMSSLTLDPAVPVLVQSSTYSVPR
jgi:hypothetical protein